MLEEMHIMLPEAPADGSPRMLPEIYKRLSEACADEAALEHGWISLGALLLRYRDSKQWADDGFESFDTFMETLRQRFKRGRTQLRSYLGVAEFFLPTISEADLEAIGVSNALEMRRASKLAGKPVPDALVLEAKALTTKELRAKLAEAFNITNDEKGTWFDLQGCFFTTDQRREFKDAAKVAMKVLGIKPSVPDHIARAEIMLAFAKEFFGTHAPEVYGTQPESADVRARYKRLGDHADFCEMCALFIEPSPCEVGRAILAGAFVENFNAATAVAGNEDDKVWVLASSIHGNPVEIFHSQKQGLEFIQTFGEGDGKLVLWTRAEAVEIIRRAVFIRDGWKCTNCHDESLTWETAEMHERLHRGQGGNISVANGTTLCHNCHMQDEEAGHGKRQPQWSKGT